MGIVVALRGAGHTAYFAGGCVRDELLDLEPADYDVATDARPDRIRSLFRRTAEVGASFGVVLVHDDGPAVEVATFRADGPYTDRRRPDSVTFSDPVADAHRRDFTINALFLDPLDDTGEPRSPRGGAVLDHVGGLRDIDARLIRAVGDPATRLAEDHLRALRAVRFAARLGFTIHERTADAIAAHARELVGVSRERIGEELRRMLAHPARAQAVALLSALGLDAPVLDTQPAEAPTPVLDALPADATYPAALAAWAIDRGALSSPDRGRATLRSWRRALCLSNDERDRMWEILTGVHLVDEQWGSLGVAQQKRTAARPWFDEALCVLKARRPDRARAVSLEVEQLRSSPGGLAPTPLVTGDDLAGLGLSPGPRFKVLLDAAYDAQLEGGVSTRAEALELVRSLGV